MTRALITGATGFIGCRMAELWHRQGRDVQALGLVRNDAEAQRAASLRRSGVPLALGDLSAPDFGGEVLDGVESVIHLAAAQHEANVDDDYFVRVNVEATRELLQKSEAHGVERFFYASSIGVYGANDRRSIDENTPLAPDNAYGRSKAAAEEALTGFDGNMRVFIGRIGETYGPWDKRLLKLYSGIKRQRFWLVGDGGNLHQPVYVDDLVLAIEKLLETPDAAGAAVILCGDRAVTTREMCESIAASLETELSRWSIPMKPLITAAVGMERTLGRMGIQPPLHRRRLDFFSKSLSFSTRLRDSLLSLPPQLSFHEGTRRTAAWYRESGWL